MSRESTFQRSSRTLRAAIDRVREEDTPRNRAVLALARHDCERVGYQWDNLPWGSGDACEIDQRFYVMHAMDRVDVLIEGGFAATGLVVPPEALAYRGASAAHRAELLAK
jgi:hypothetical protein